jgi:hypothetical protein
MCDDVSIDTATQAARDQVSILRHEGDKDKALKEMLQLVQARPHWLQGHMEVGGYLEARALVHFEAAIVEY